MNNHQNLTVIDGETLMDKRLPPTKFCVDTLLPQGLCILGGSPKVGKSWLVLDLCVHVAQGTPLWGLDVARGDVLYLCLEDSERRIQERLNTITDNVPDGMFFATGCTSIESGVCDWLRDFKRQHPAITLVAIDTFQLIRTPTPDVSYGGDYAELRVLKELADELGKPIPLSFFYRKDFRMNKQNKDYFISFRVTAEEKKWIEEHSYGNYRLISDFVRDCVFEKDIVIINGLDEFSAQLRRIGNNVNQLTRAVNAGYATQINLTETRKELEKIWQSLNSLLQDAR